MKIQVAEGVRLILPESALTVIFDECDRFNRDETGGRVVGTYKENDGELTISVAGVIESGPAAQRTRVSFFQDGPHQERIFRQLESSHPEIEHLGNWHTHHVNGLSTLSNGDIATYRRTVDHHNHNTSFFYALLVTDRNKTADPFKRYSLKHYIFRREDESVYEIPQTMVKFTKTHLLWPLAQPQLTNHEVKPPAPRFGAHQGRVYDRDIIAEFYQGIRSFASQKVGIYWRGPIELVNRSRVEVIIMEDSSCHTPKYSIALREPPDELKALAEQFASKAFPSARAALITIERTCNHALYEKCSRSQGVKS